MRFWVRMAKLSLALSCRNKTPDVRRLILYCTSGLKFSQGGTVRAPEFIIVPPCINLTNKTPCLSQKMVAITVEIVFLALTWPGDGCFVSPFIEVLILGFYEIPTSHTLWQCWSPSVWYRFKRSSAQAIHFIWCSSVSNLGTQRAYSFWNCKVLGTVLCKVVLRTFWNSNDQGWNCELPINRIFLSTAVNKPCVMLMVGLIPIHLGHFADTH